MKAVVLLSGGIDSTTCLAIAVSRCGAENVSALTVYYGQKHAKEIECAEKVAQYYGVKRYEVDLSATMKFSDCPLLAGSAREIAHESYVDQIKHNGTGTVATYVPFRNGLMLSAAGALALSIYPSEEVNLYYGAHADDAAGRAYPDCTPEFTKAMGEALYEGSGRLLNLCAPLINLNKAGVVKWGTSLGAPYGLTWSCYEGGEKHCGKCGTCIDRHNAFVLNKLEDPTDYE